MRFQSPCHGAAKEVCQNESRQVRSARGQLERRPRVDGLHIP